MAGITNRLAKESSPYLLQHANNPVDWYPWGDEALEKARKEDKPILVSIGYSACHWCHVMERESFEDAETAEIMNARFINIKIDREERPDLDHIYMDAVQVMTGSGGWPLNVFLTPEGKPFYGGTYFPPVRAFNRPSWKEVLTNISDNFTTRRKEIEEQAGSLLDHLSETNSFGFPLDREILEAPDVFTNDNVETIFQNLMKSADTTLGGFGAAPKFPQSFSIRYLLHYHYYTGNQVALDQALLSLDKMAMGGIYDHLGGGFARYSTDAEWLAPHFEKMLYDNALLLDAYGEAFRLTGKKRYAAVIRDTMGFIERELLSEEGGFYAALDADSEGVEGKYYVWQAAEVRELLQDDAALFMEYYDISDAGNWEHQSILRERSEPEAIAQRYGLSPAALEQRIQASKQRLLTHRQHRIRPQLDDKILLGWNALMNSACSAAYRAVGDDSYLQLAIRNMNFLWEKMKYPDRTAFYHTYKYGTARIPAFLDDYAFLIRALIDLQEVTGDTNYLEKARVLTERVIEEFSEAATGFFYYTGFAQNDVVLRKKEIYDNAVPSGNSIMAWNLYYLGVIFDNVTWRNRGVSLCSNLEKLITKYPGSFGNWARLMLALTKGIPEIALVGENINDFHQDILRIFLPSSIYQSTSTENNHYPLLGGKPLTHEAQVYICRDFTCGQPVKSLQEVQNLIREG